ncbi:MAG TPA: hypothetical protein VMT15_05905 [Bryobacteraceae bacterium]|nr:hypothetical protein [Bryobacteraceae bacterium]
MRLLDQLASTKGQFGPASAAHAASLLERAKQTRIRDAAELIRLHETALYLRAYPQSHLVLRLADEILFHFAERMPTDQDAFGDPEISGIAGTVVSTNFSYEFARSLAARHGRAVQIDWENFEHPERLAPALKKLIPVSRDDWAVEAHPDYRAWFEKGGGNVEWLLGTFTPEMYGLMEIPLRWDPGKRSRSHLRIPRRDFYIHGGPFLRREPGMIAKALASPPIPRKRLGRNRAQEIIGVIVDASAVRYRELYGFQYPNLDRIEHASPGRGIDVFLFGPARKLPVREYLCGMYFKNGVPVGYIECLTNKGNMEVGFNLYYTFREGETAWLYAMLLKLAREWHKGVRTFSVDPYQIGHENEEALASGAFWFYRKLGFMPAAKELWPVLEREELRLAQPGYRTSRTTLRKLAESRMIYNLQDT